MNAEDVKKTIEELNKEDKKKFNQSIDLIITFKGLDLKKPDHQQDFFLQLHKSRGRDIKICAIVGPELADEAKEVCDKVILGRELDEYKDKKLGKKLARQYDFFIGQANIMGKIAQIFGRTLGPKGKMPNPKAGAVIPPKGSVKNVYEKLKDTIRISVKSQLQYSVSVGKEDSNIEDIIDNITTIYNALVKHLPQEKNNIKNILIKKSMSKGLPLKY